MTVKANKVAAGVEAEKTNELFQNLAKAINMKVLVSYFNVDTAIGNAIGNVITCFKA